MDAKKGLAGLVLGVSLSVAALAGPQVSFQQPKEQKHHQLRLQLHKDYRLCLPEQFSLAQKHLKGTGKDYMVLRAPGDNMPIIIPDASKYPMPIIKPGPEWYRDDKFIIKPSPEWQLPKDWLNSEKYKGTKAKRAPGALIYQRGWKRM